MTSRSLLRFFSLAAALCLSTVILWSADRKPRPVKKAPGFRGRVVFAGKIPPARVLPMGSDPICLKQHPKGFIFQPFAVGKTGGLADVFVYVKKGLEGKNFETPKEAAVLDQKGCWYYPRVIGAMVGQRVELLNSDPTIHNVNALPEFNVSMPPGLKKIEKTFVKPAVMQKLKCNVHPWMTAYVGVLEHPFYAVTDLDGAYEIRGLPPGKYVLEAWHERLGVLTRAVTVDGGVV
ncbi:MAG: hypothetical protein HY551_05320, partial [Elusimicrobia bacterium]|nr:hypothetical protein [Elusimicrobiota bacterium]